MICFNLRSGTLLKKQAAKFEHQIRKLKAEYEDTLNRAINLKPLNTAMKTKGVGNANTKTGSNQSYSNNNTNLNAVSSPHIQTVHL